jgi:hypothetical protein
MKRSIIVCVFLAAAAALGAQEEGQTNPYQGTSNPPPDDTIVTTTEAAPLAKPAAGKRLYAQPAAQQAAPRQNAYPTQPTSVDPALNFPDPGNDDGVVQVTSDSASQLSLSRRSIPYDPDGDIVHPAGLGPGQLGEGTTIRVHLLGRISSADAVSGESFRSRVVNDVLQNGQVLIPAGSEIDGRILLVSSGHPGGRGSMHLRPEIVVLPDGSRFRMYAQVTGAPGSKARVGSEGTIYAGSRLKKDGIEYGGAVGAGALTGAYLAGPVGALTGSLIGAGVITAHLLISHPQATLETGTTLQFTLTQQLNLVPAATSGY